MIAARDKVSDPLKLAKMFWPHVTFYRKQKEVIYSVWDDGETIVPAANELGKDFVAAFICLAFFLTRYPCRIVTTSAKEPHLDVLWGEIGRFIQTSRYPLEYKLGGPLAITHRDIRRKIKDKEQKNYVDDEISYIIGMVASQDSMAAMLGHHATPDNLAAANDGIPRTLFVCDEASSARNEYFEMARTWANRMLIIGNPWPCENYFKHAVKGKPGSDIAGGNLVSHDAEYYLRRIIRIKGDDSPNVQLGLEQERVGISPTNEILIPGVLSYQKYKERRMLWDEHQQSVGLDADWYEGAGARLIPSFWLDMAQERAEQEKLTTKLNYKADAIGVDTAEGQDLTAMAAGNRQRLLDLRSMRTPDTSIIPKQVLDFAREFQCDPENIYFDRGGGGRQHVDRLVSEGYEVNSVGFGERVKLDILPGGMHPYDEKVDNETRKYAYKNRRAEMYGMIRELLNPANGREFAIPSELLNRSRVDGGPSLRKQLEALPLWYDGEGRMYLPPKNRRPDGKESHDKITINSLIGCSPDEADAFALMVYGLEREVAEMVISMLI